MNWEAVGLVAVGLCVIIVLVAAVLLWIKFILDTSDKYGLGWLATATLALGPLITPLVVLAYFDAVAYLERTAGG